MVSATSRKLTPPKRIPGEEGIWLFVFGDMMMFSMFFITFLYYRAGDPAVFRDSQAHLNQNFGAINTFLMLTSSWFVAMAIHAARHNLGKVTPVLLLSAALCGAGFVVIKFFEYREKVLAGMTLTTNDFFMYYYMFTGIHLLHVLIGMAVIAFMANYSRRGRMDERQIGILECAASFWHAVDVLWIVLFALFYLVR